MKRFEYLMVELKVYKPFGEFGMPVIARPAQLRDKTLNQIGDLGWEAIGFPNQGYLLFKRELTVEEPVATKPRRRRAISPASGADATAPDLDDSDEDDG